MLPTTTVRKQVALQAPLFDKRAAIISRLLDFWTLVFEQAPQEIDQYISPSDSAAIAALDSFEVTRFEVALDGASGTSITGEPRSVSFKFVFVENPIFHDEVLEKKFWYRRANDGWTGLVSEPVKIHWKAGQDLTGGMLDMAVRVWERQMARAQATTAGADQGPVQEYDELVRRVRKMNAGSLSFFAWFGFRGRDISAYESDMATREEQERRQRVKREGFVVEGSEEGDESADEEADEEAAEGENGEVRSDEEWGDGEESEDGVESGDEDNEDDEDDEDVDDGAIPTAHEMEREIFPGGDDLAVSLSDDLFLGAIKYFSECIFEVATRHD